MILGKRISLDSSTILYYPEHSIYLGLLEFYRVIGKQNPSERPAIIAASMDSSFGRIILEVFILLPSVSSVCNSIQWEPRVISIESLERLFRERI